jgi:protein gp37
MGENSKIPWCDHTFNPWIGCTPVSPGCANCYARREFDDRRGMVRWGYGFPRHLCRSTWDLPERWNRKAERDGTRPRVFCGSLCDVFDEEVKDEWKYRLFHVINKCRNLRWLLLSKRSFAARTIVNAMYGLMDLAHVWVGLSVEDQQRANVRIRELLEIPCGGRFLSLEPLLGPVELNLGSIPHSAIDWVIAGGESGPDARPMDPEWVRSLRDQCDAFGVPFFFKQYAQEGHKRPEVIPVLDGMIHQAFPEGLR